jgi:hypothetical protein
MLRTAPMFLTMKKDQKINVMLTPEELREIEDAMLAERIRSMSAFGRELILRGLRDLRREQAQQSAA